MARRRYVSTTISQDTRVNRLATEHGDFAALLYTWMIPHAADDATLPADPEELLYLVLPGRRDKSVEDVRLALDGMLALGLLEDVAPGRIGFPARTFYKYQTYVACRNRAVPVGESDSDDNGQVPPEDTEVRRTTPRTTIERRTTPQKGVSPSPSFNPSPSLSPSPSETPPLTPPLGGRPPPAAREGARIRPVRGVPKPRDRPAEPDPLRDALVAGIGVVPTTSVERATVDRVARELWDLGATPTEVRKRCAHFRLTWPKAQLTAPGLLAHWSRMEHAPPPQTTGSASNERAKIRRTLESIAGVEEGTMDRRTFQTALSKLAIALSAEISPERANLYWEDLSDLTDEQFAIACTRARREWDRPYVLPPIATLLRYAAEASAVAGAIVDGASAWDAFTSRVLRRYSFGVTKAFDWPDALTRQVVREHLGIAGPAVHTLATLETDFERERFRRAFIAAYNARRGTAAAQERRGTAVPLRLVGEA